MKINENSFLIISYILTVIAYFTDIHFFFYLSILPTFFYILIICLKIPKFIKNLREKKRKNRYFSEIWESFQN